MAEPSDGVHGSWRPFDGLDMTGETPRRSHFPARDRRSGLRTDLAELLVLLEEPVLLRGRTIWDGLTVGLADGDRGRVLLESSGTVLRTLTPGPAELLASSPYGMLRFPANVLEVDRAVAVVEVDYAFAEFEERRRSPRFALHLPTRVGQADGVPPETLVTTNVSASGMLVDHPAFDADPGSPNPVLLEVGLSELAIDGVVARRDGSAVAIRFTHATPAAERSLHIALAREASGRDV